MSLLLLRFPIWYGDDGVHMAGLLSTSGLGSQTVLPPSFAFLNLLSVLLPSGNSILISVIYILLHPMFFIFILSSFLASPENRAFDISTLRTPSSSDILLPPIWNSPSGHPVDGGDGEPEHLAWLCILGEQIFSLLDVLSTDVNVAVPGKSTYISSMVTLEQLASILPSFTPESVPVCVPAS